MSEIKRAVFAIVLWVSGFLAGIGAGIFLIVGMRYR
jgi:hypothetical protein